MLPPNHLPRWLRANVSACVSCTRYDWDHWPLGSRISFHTTFVRYVLLEFLIHRRFGLCEPRTRRPGSGHSVRDGTWFSIAEEDIPIVRLYYYCKALEASLVASIYRLTQTLN